jgi:hypothetical protein
MGAAGLNSGTGLDYEKGDGMGKSKTIRVSRDWLGNAIPTALEMIARGLDQPAWYAETFGLTPQKALENVIESLRQQARE